MEGLGDGILRTSSDQNDDHEAIHVKNSTLQEKIDAVQQILTILETTMSSARTDHQGKQSSRSLRIEQMQAEIIRLQQEMETEECRFKGATEALETNIHQFIACENKLRTVEETCEDDYVTIPEIDSESERFLESYMEEGKNEWRTLKRQCKNLNYSTQKALDRDIFVKRFKVVMPLPSNEMIRRAAVAANALNMLRGKKMMDQSLMATTMVHYVKMTCFKNEHTAIQYMENNFTEIIYQVLSKEHDDVEAETLVITELPDTFSPSKTILERTIHVQGKTAALNANSNTRRKITVYQFDDVTNSNLNQLTTYSVETDSVVSRSSSVEGSVAATSPNRSSRVHSVEGFPIPFASSQTHLSNASQPRPSSSRANYNSIGQFTQRQLSRKTSKILSSLGIEELTDISSPAPSSSSSKKEDDKNQHVGNLVDGVNNNFVNSNLPSDSVDTSGKVLDGVELREWVWKLAQNKGIQYFNDSQKEFFHSLKLNGDIIFKGIANSGKTTGMILGVLNEIDAEMFKPQVLVLTLNNRSSKLIQNNAVVDTEKHMVLCRRYDELIEIDRKDKKQKMFKRAQCHLLVGSAQEMYEMLTNGVVKPESVTLLVLYKLEEMFGPDTIRKNIFTTIQKILYTLNATIKVIVVCKSNAKVCQEMQQLCNSKLRNKITIEESVELKEFFQDKERSRKKSGENQTALGKEPEDQSPSPEQFDLIEPLLVNTAKKEVRPLHQQTVAQEVSESPNDETDPGTIQVPTEDRSVQNLQGSESAEIPRDNSGQGKTFIPWEAIKLLGVFVEPSILETNLKGYESERERNLVHFYANITEQNSMDNKAHVISMLDLEQDKGIIFCNSIKTTEWLSTRLRQRHLLPQVLHENVSRIDQRAALENYRQGVFCRVLICTDFVLSISLDKADIVLNFDLPKSHLIYTNRAAFAYRGTNTRSGIESDKNGIVVSLVSDAETHRLNEFQRILGINILNCEDD